jgi:hypothetical protein
MIDKDPESDVRKSYTGVALTGLLLILTFLLLLLVIVNSAPTDQVQQTSLPSRLPWIVWIFTTRRSAFVYETLVAGMLGAYLGELSRIADVKARANSPEYTLHFRGALFLGGTAAIVTGVLLPLVVLDKFEGQGINSWTLVAAGGIAGNLARGSFSRAESTITRLLASFESRFDRTTISESVKTGIQEAFAVPQPINYEGFLAMDVTRSNESVIAPAEKDGNVARLQRGEPFELRVQFASEKSLNGSLEHGIVKPISIRGGDDQPQAVPFRLLVDFGFVEVAPEERIVTVPRRGPSAIERFTFLVPVEHVLGSLDNSLSPHSRFQPEICVSIYQHARYFDSVVLPVTIRT